MSNAQDTLNTVREMLQPIAEFAKDQNALMTARRMLIAMETPDEDVLRRAQVYVDKTYTASADARQKEMGLAYVTAERIDLAREFAKFALLECARE
jgi:hypothetical protein